MILKVPAGTVVKDAELCLRDRIGIYAKDRREDAPFVIGGGPCTYNPEPLADFFDMFYIGESETVYYDLMDLYKEHKQNGGSRKEFLRKASHSPGIYVPSLYETTYNEDGTIASFEPLYEDVPRTILKQVQMDLSNTFYPEKQIVPYIKVTPVSYTHLDVYKRQV